MSNVQVGWTVAAGGGAVAPSASRTDAQGDARTTWTLGTVPGANVLKAAPSGLPEVTFSVAANPGPPASMAAASAVPGQAPAGTAVAPAPTVVVRDGYGNAVPGAVVAFTVEAGAGSVAAAVVNADTDGRASAAWTLGTAVGGNTLVARTGALEPVSFSVQALPGEAARIEPLQPAAQTGTAGLPVAALPAVTVRDRFENPVPGVVVEFTVDSGGGSVSGAVRVSGPDGVARVDGWTLGTVAGLNVLRAAAAGLPPVTFSADGRAGRPASVQVEHGDGQTALRGTAVSVPPSVRVTDVHGNRVAGETVTFAVTAGGGSVSGAQQQTSAEGIAQVGSWTLGAAAGQNRLTAAAADAPAAVFTAQATGDAPAFNVWVEGVHLNQGSQRADGSIGATAQRGGLLRVLVRANQENTQAPPVRVRLLHGATVLREVTVPAPRVGVPVAPDLDVLTSTWNVVLSPDDVVPGMSVEAFVDPGATMVENSTDDNRFPRGTGSAPLDVVALHPLRIIFIPIHATVQNRTGSITAANVETFLTATRQWIPATSIITSVRAPYTTGLNLASGSAWSALLTEIQAMRTLEGAIDQYYHGIIGDFSGIPYGGLAYRPTQPSSSSRSGLSYDRMPAAPATIAHELGHNLGRMHAPCGNPANQDTNYPHAGAVIGAAGFDLLAGQIRRSSDFRDYMSYCSPRWTSDYTYAGILQWRRNDPRAQPGAIAHAALHAAPTAGVLVWGRMGSDGVTLSPAFTLVAPPTLPEGPGANVLSARAHDGRELFRFSFDGTPVEDAADPHERHFAFFVPLAEVAMGELARIEVSTPVGEGVRAVAPPPPGAAPPMPFAGVSAAAAEAVRVQWDDALFPMALVRDASTGRVLSFARGGDALVRSAGIPLQQLEVLLSDGVRSWRPAVR